ncbi:uncharacterized protein BX663DRAFT_520223 [Cokeromyces recurvatus]|uniref:uncharacterized protein n=1 Tax=Cokeromyces recurvatus TaxID=90255 RepID=UPI00221F000F|nr:uncharacterized protein BX663DRAFT_520223 [Cokeromyces recurvatus]KAI7899728.1 hypothetical protein BX663DRAFT_520223 [Cokeromyces recurvatus]
MLGLIIQARRKKDDFLKGIPEEDWEICFKHVLDGPITKFSKSAEDDGPVQFGVLYHKLEEDHIRHYVRVYYISNMKYEYKNAILPGTTKINAISIEQDSILYSRDPDSYRFRVAIFPSNLLLPPHSENSNMISLIESSQTGDPVQVFHQPSQTESHANLVCKLYSPNINTYRVFTLDIHKTKHLFHTNVSIVDGRISQKEKNQIKSIEKWIPRDHLNSDDSTMMDENLEYMAFVDGAHFHQERITIHMPTPAISRSRESKTIVVSLLRNDFQTLDYTDKLNALLKDPYERRYLYRNEDKSLLNEFYHTMQVPDSVVGYSNDYDTTMSDIRGVQLNNEGTLLAIWTDSNSIYIYKRGLSDRAKIASPHYLERPLRWNLRMMMMPKESYIGSITPIGAVLFWNKNGSNYISVGMKNQIVNTYLIDEIKDQHYSSTNFKAFLKEKWDLWIIMSMIVMIFVLNEYKTYPAV